MDLRELRLGNWIEDSNEGISQIGCIDIRSKNVGLINPLGGSHDGTELEFTRPIRLTREKLLDFGFVFLKNKSGTLGVYTNGKMNVTISNSGNVYRMSKLIPYVHKLQNLYFELHDEELTKKQ